MDIKDVLCYGGPACYIFGAGEFYGLRTRPKEGDLVIAADGGMRVLEQLFIRPDIVLGDFDSGDAGEALALSDRSGAELVRLNVIKDVSDSAAAKDIGLERGYKVFYFYGCTGKRLDHTLATIQDLAALSLKGSRAFLFDRDAVITAINNGKLSFPADMQGFISVFAHGGRADGVSEQGLKFCISDAELKDTFPLGLSNEFIGEPSEISVRDGTLIIYFQVGNRYEG